MAELDQLQYILTEIKTSLERLELRIAKLEGQSEECDDQGPGKRRRMWTRHTSELLKSASNRSHEEGGRAGRAIVDAAAVSLHSAAEALNAAVDGADDERQRVNRDGRARHSGLASS